ncbi:MAG: hypothetical protein KDC44_02765 [Phaeodactylibacter sp.]|nr:hypothetical protein [Phaeodactylibacter sp.]
MGIGTKIILIVILLHLIAGFGYMVYVLLPKKGDAEEAEADQATDNTQPENAN